MNKAKKLVGSIGLLVGVTLLTACGASADGNEEDVVKIGVVGENNDVWDFVIDKLEEDDINVELVKFTDYSQPNSALAAGEIQLNSFQHQIFLDS